MPKRPRSRRSRGRRTLPPRPPGPARPPTVGVPAAATATTQPGTTQPGTRRRASAASERPARLIERDAPLLLGELRRIVLISGACLGLLVVLVAVDRLG